MSNLIQNTNGRLVVCKNCQTKWTYRGRKRFYATCPDCRRNVKLPRDDAIPDKGSIGDS